MKNFLILILFFSSIYIYSQNEITYEIKEVKVNGTLIPNNGSIQFGNNSSVTINFKVEFTKPSYLTIGSVSHVIGTQTPSGFTQLFTPESFSLNNGNSGFSGIWEKVIYASDYSSTGENYLVSKLTQTAGTPPLNWESNHIPIVKSPSFTFSPTSLSLPCGDTSTKTFTVTPSNIPSGATVSYQWNYNGWNGSVNPWQNSVILSPITSTPGNVSVTPFINGVAQPIKTCTVSLAPISSSATINGNSNFCSGSSNYTLANAGTNGVTWSISDTSVATISNANSTGVTVNKVGNGVVVLTATLTNACNQTVSKTKTINIGAPAAQSVPMKSCANVS